LASAVWSSILPALPLLLLSSLLIRSFLERSREVLFLLKKGNKRNFHLGFPTGLPKEACPATPRYSLHHSHSDRSADRTQNPIEKKQRKKERKKQKKVLAS
jgi:hypothetical protein